MVRRPDDYAAFAPVYDLLTAAPLAGLRRDVAEAFAAAGCRRVLDVCCGTGALCAVLAARGIETWGIDVSPSMLARAARSACGARLVLGDAARMPFPDGAFDGAVASLALHENRVETADAVVAEMLRVARPGGTLLVAEWDAEGIRGPRGALVHVVERCAGRRHYAGFRGWLAAGGLGGLAARHRLDATLLGRRFGGALALAALRPEGLGAA